jgi:hypothetical protein
MSKRRHRSRKHYRALGDGSCAKLSIPTRRVLGIGAGAVIGAASVFGTYFLANLENRRLQKAAGAPMPTPNFFVGTGAVILAAVGGTIGNHLATKKPTC